MSGPHCATLFIPPASDLDDGERADLFDKLVAFGWTCQRRGLKPQIRVLPGDPDGHAERRTAGN